jgi:hypothetical protein
MTNIREVEEEYWTVQYLTSVLGYREPIFWPLDGDGKHRSEADALSWAGVKLADHPAVRVVHVIRRSKFGEPITSLEALGS